jgi:catechol 2,3-dioxygenase-like lactoylglutathione lyase family enzyme
MSEVSAKKYPEDGLKCYNRRYMQSKISHIGINLSSEEKSFPIWKALLEYLEFTIVSDGNHFDANDGHSFLCFTATKPDYQKPLFHRRHTGLNHIAFGVDSREAVDIFVKEFISPRGIELLYGGAKEYDYAEGYYAVYFEDPDRIKVEVAYEGK